MKKQLIKLGNTNPNLRPQIRRILSASQKLSAEKKNPSIKPLKDIMQRLGIKWTASERKLLSIWPELEDRDLENVFQAAKDTIDDLDGFKGWVNPKTTQLAVLYYRTSLGEIDARKSQSKSLSINQEASDIAHKAKPLASWQPNKKDIMIEGGLYVLVSALLPIWGKISGLAAFINNPDLEVIKTSYNKKDLKQVIKVLAKAPRWVAPDDPQIDLLERASQVFQAAYEEREEANSAFPEAYDFLAENLHKWVSKNERRIIGDYNIREWEVYETSDRRDYIQIKCRYLDFLYDMYMVSDENSVDWKEADRNINKVVENLIRELPPPLVIILLR